MHGSCDRSPPHEPSDRCGLSCHIFRMPSAALRDWPRIFFWPDIRTAGNLHSGRASAGQSRFAPKPICAGDSPVWKFLAGRQSRVRVFVEIANADVLRAEAIEIELAAAAKRRVGVLAHRFFFTRTDRSKTTGNSAGEYTHPTAAVPVTAVLSESQLRRGLCRRAFVLRSIDLYVLDHQIDDAAQFRSCAIAGRQRHIDIFQGHVFNDVAGRWSDRAEAAETSVTFEIEMLLTMRCGRWWP